MNLRSKVLTAVGGAVLLATSAIAIAENSAPDAKSAARLAQALAGRAAGPMVDCVPNLHGKSRMEVVDDNTILFKDGSVIYLQKPQGGCQGLADGRYSLVTERVGTHQICRGDINRLVDLQSGFQGGSCVYDSFVPYRKVG